MIPKKGMKFKIGDSVVVRPNDAKGSERIPKYIQGRVGRVIQCYGRVQNPLDHRGVYSPLYSIEFKVSELFDNKSKELLTADVHEDSLEAAAGVARKKKKSKKKKGGSS